MSRTRAYRPRLDRRRCRCTAFPRTKIIIVWHHFDSSHFLSQTVAVEADAAVIKFCRNRVSFAARSGRICSEAEFVRNQILRRLCPYLEIENVDILQGRQYGVALLPRISVLFLFASPGHCGASVVGGKDALLSHGNVYHSDPVRPGCFGKVAILDSIASSEIKFQLLETKPDL
jgi:hypothetical protein